MAPPNELYASNSNGALTFFSVNINFPLISSPTNLVRNLGKSMASIPSISSYHE